MRATIVIQSLGKVQDNSALCGESGTGVKCREGIADSHGIHDG
jgi:hypothetical protein